MQNKIANVGNRDKTGELENHYPLGVVRERTEKNGKNQRQNRSVFPN